MEEIPQIPRFKEIESLFELSISDLKNVEFLNNVDIFIDIMLKKFDDISFIKQPFIYKIDYFYNLNTTIFNSIGEYLYNYSKYLIDQDDSLNSILKIDSVDINENNIIIYNKNRFENILIYLKNIFNKIKEVLNVFKSKNIDNEEEKQKSIYLLSIFNKLTTHNLIEESVEIKIIKLMFLSSFITEISSNEKIHYELFVYMNKIFDNLVEKNTRNSINTVLINKDIFKDKLSLDNISNQLICNFKDKINELRQKINFDPIKLSTDYPDLLFRTIYDNIFKETDKLYKSQIEILIHLILGLKNGYNEKASFSILKTITSEGKTSLVIPIVKIIQKLNLKNIEVIYCCDLRLNSIRSQICSQANRYNIPYGIAGFKDTKFKIFDNKYVKPNNQRLLLISDTNNTANILQENKEKNYILFYDEPTAFLDETYIDLKEIKSSRYEYKPESRKLIELYSNLPSYTILASATLPKQEKMENIINNYIKKQQDLGKIRINNKYIKYITSTSSKIGSEIYDNVGRLYLPNNDINNLDDFNYTLSNINSDLFLKKMYTIYVLSKLWERLVELNISINSELNFFNIFNDPNKLTQERSQQIALEYLNIIKNKNDQHILQEFNSLNISGINLSQNTNLNEIKKKLKGTVLYITKDPLGKIKEFLGELYQNFINFFKTKYRRGDEEYTVSQIIQKLKGNDFSVKQIINEFLQNNNLKYNLDNIIFNNFTDIRDDYIYFAILFGIGIYNPKNLDEKYTEEIIKLSNSIYDINKLNFIFSDTDITYGTNFSIENIIIDDSCFINTNHSINTIFQLIGRAGRIGKSWKSTIYCYPVVLSILKDYSTNPNYENIEDKIYENIGYLIKNSEKLDIADKIYLENNKNFEQNLKFKQDQENLKKGIYDIVFPDDTNVELKLFLEPIFNSNEMKEFFMKENYTNKTINNCLKLYIKFISGEKNTNIKLFLNEFKQNQKELNKQIREYFRLVLFYDYEINKNLEYENKINLLKGIFSALNNKNKYGNKTLGYIEDYNNNNYDYKKILKLISNKITSEMLYLKKKYDYKSIRDNVIKYFEYYYINYCKSDKINNIKILEILDNLIEELKKTFLITIMFDNAIRCKNIDFNIILQIISLFSNYLKTINIENYFYLDIFEKFKTTFEKSIFYFKDDFYYDVNLDSSLQLYIIDVIESRNIIEKFQKEKLSLEKTNSLIISLINDIKPLNIDYLFDLNIDIGKDFILNNIDSEKNRYNNLKQNQQESKQETKKNEQESKQNEQASWRNPKLKQDFIVLKNGIYISSKISEDIIKCLEKCFNESIIFKDLLSKYGLEKLQNKINKLIDFMMQNPNNICRYGILGNKFKEIMEDVKEQVLKIKNLKNGLEIPIDNDTDINSCIIKFYDTTTVNNMINDPNTGLELVQSSVNQMIEYMRNNKNTLCKYKDLFPILTDIIKENRNKIGGFIEIEKNIYNKYKISNNLI